MVAVINQHPEEKDIFSLLEISLTAGRIARKCVVDTARRPYGGTSHVGLESGNFYVYVGGGPRGDPMLLALQNLTSDALRFRPGSKGSSLLTGPSPKIAAVSSTQERKRALGRFET